MKTMPPEKKSPTIYDVAKLAGVSISTISRVLNSPDKVNPETHKRVMEAIDRLGFVPRAAARAHAITKHQSYRCADALLYGTIVCTKVQGGCFGPVKGKL